MTAPSEPVAVDAVPSRRVDRFLQLMVERGASDLHLTVGRPPMFRLSGEMDPIRYRTLTNSDFDGLMRPIATPELWAAFQASGDIDFAYQLGTTSRFRVNLFKHERGAGAVLRVIPTRIMSIEQLSLPVQTSRLAKLRSGLVLVTGPTGSGKSTTLAAIIDLINRTRDMHLITIEDPIEFVHPNKRCLVHQREVGAHAASFADALRVAVREDPDIILVGEMRDLETITMALEAAEKGMVVFGTLHTNNAAKTIDRIVNVFPSGEQDGIRQVLGETVRSIVAQQLLPKVGGGRVAALEILFGTPQVGNMIREGKIAQLTSLIQTAKTEGMVSMDQSIVAHLLAGVVTPEAALDKAIDKELLRKTIATMGAGAPPPIEPPARPTAPPPPARVAAAPPRTAPPAARPLAATSPAMAPPRPAAPPPPAPVVIRPAAPPPRAVPPPQATPPPRAAPSMPPRPKG